MKKIYLFIILIILFGCNNNNHSTAVDERGKLPISLSLEPLISNNINVTRVKATISRNDWTDSINLIIDDNNATGLFENLYVGTYEISVFIYSTDPISDEEILVASGTGTGEVIAGETTTVSITLVFEEFTGSLEIIIDWEIEPIVDNVLWIGNSYTYVNGGVNTVVENLFSAAHPDEMLHTEALTMGGATLENHWNNATTQETIANTEWDYVILQEQSTRPIQEPQLMYQYADSLATFIQNQNENSAFFMTWARDYDPDTIEDLAAAYNHCGQITDSEVFSVGRAFQKVVEDTDNHLDLYSSDGSHPNNLGTYLAGCVFYIHLFNENVSTNEYIMENMTVDEAQYLQNIAWETFLEYN